MDRTALNRRFHALLNNLGIMDRKEDILSGYGVGSTKELTDGQLSEIIDRLSDERKLRTEAAQRRERSIALSLLTDLGVYYTLPDERKRARWERVDGFVRSPKLSGKNFYDLDTEELRALSRKLRSMKERGYYYRRDTPQAEPSDSRLRDLSGQASSRQGSIHVFIDLNGDTGPVN